MRESGLRNRLNLVLDTGKEMNNKHSDAVTLALFNLVKYFVRCYKQRFANPGSLTLPGWLAFTTPPFT
jgi:hypothetical protein